MRKFTVKEGDREREVLIVGTPEEMKDKSYMNHLTEAYKEKTSDQLKKLKPKEKSTKSKSDISGALKELSEFRQRKQDNVNKRYF